MQLTREGDYAVRIMTDLAAAPWGAIVPRRQIQERQDVPPALLAKIVQALARTGLVRTSGGRGEG
jgi:DNA-binding IscR family transcriptional regulator